MLRIGYLGPEGTFSHEAALAAGVRGELVALRTVHEVVLAVQDSGVDHGLVPIENALEGAISATLDALAFDAPDVRIVGELVHPIHHCLIADRARAPGELEVVVSHPQPLAQCATFLRDELPRARAVAATSTAEAVRAATGTTGAIGTRAAAELYGASVLRAGIEDAPDNVTRFVWLSRGRSGGAPAADAAAATRTAPAADAAAATRTAPAADAAAATRTALLFHGSGDATPGWLVRCLSEFAFRGVNLTRIESRPLRSRLGHYLFHVDCDGGEDEPAVAAAIEGLRTHCERVRVLGSYAASIATIPAGHGGPDTT